MNSTTFFFTLVSRWPSSPSVSGHTKGAAQIVSRFGPMQSEKKQFQFFPPVGNSVNKKREGYKNFLSICQSTLAVCPHVHRLSHCPKRSGIIILVKAGVCHHYHKERDDLLLSIMRSAEIIPLRILLPIYCRSRFTCTVLQKWIMMMIVHLDLCYICDHPASYEEEWYDILVKHVLLHHCVSGCNTAPRFPITVMMNGLTRHCLFITIQIWIHFFSLILTSR